MSSGELASSTPFDLPAWTDDALDLQRTPDCAERQPIHSTKAHLLIVNDDGSLRQTVADHLKSQNMELKFLAAAQDIAGRIEELAPSIVLINQPKGQNDGLDLLRQIRSLSDIPVIIIAESNTEEADRVIGLELGADDYLTMPFGVRELCARVRAVLRRNALCRETQRHDPRSVVYRFGSWQLHERTRRLFDPEGTQVALTKAEYALLFALVSCPGRPLSREHLISATRVNDDVFDRSIDVAVYRLRRKLKTDRSLPPVIQTERGVGYRFAISVEQICFK
jgi:two-component system OmpR family response regulator